MVNRHQVIVVGAGPAGLNAAKYAANAGAEVALIDAGNLLGGQYWRHTGNELMDQKLHRNFDQGSLLMDAVLANSRITVYSGESIWSASLIDEQLLLRTSSAEFSTSRLIIATGAYDRALAFPGWDIPGVMTPGAVQALLKGSGVLAGKQIVVAGTGPFLLSVAAGIVKAGGQALGVLEASAKSAWFKELLTLLVNPTKIMEGAGYVLELRSKKVAVRYRQAVVAAHAGSDGLLESVTVANINPDFTIRSTYQLKCDVAAVGWGFTPDTSLAALLGVEQLVASDGSTHVQVDENQRANLPGSKVEIYAAGESTGVGGYQLALLEGAVAGLSAAHSRQSTKELKKGRKRATRFARALLKVYPIAPGWKSWLTPTTLICRCEEVSYQSLLDAKLKFSATDSKAAKLFTRCGMGFCQGRVCGRNVSDLLDGDSSDRIQSTYRPIINPITLGDLAGEGLL